MCSADLANAGHPGELAELLEEVLMRQGVALPSAPVPHWGGWTYSARGCDVRESLCGTERDPRPC